MSRYILNRVAEKYECGVSFNPKPYGSEWAGSGLHKNVFTNEMRKKGGFYLITEIIMKSITPLHI